MTHRILCGAALCALLAAPALADELPGTSRFFETYDRNADGVVTAEEFDGSPQVFRLLDKDGDGAIQGTDLGLPADYRPKKKAAPPAKPGRTVAPEDGDRAARRRARLERQLKRMDADGDGKVTKDEWKGPPRVFERIDRNGDGVIDAEDRRPPEERDAMGGEMGGEKDGPPAAGEPQATPGTEAGPRPNKGPRGPRRGARPGPGFAQRLKAMDTNGDGKLTQDEWKLRPEIFQRMDRDGDGEIVLADFLPERGSADAPDADAEKPRRAKRSFDEKLLKRFDTNRDGVVTRDEFPGREARFDAMDTDGDGKLTKADIPAETSKEATGSK